MITLKTKKINIEIDLKMLLFQINCGKIIIVN